MMSRNRIERPRHAKDKVFPEQCGMTAAEEMEGDASRCQAFLSPDSNRELDANSPFDMPDMGSFDNRYHYPGLTTEVAIEIYIRLMRRMHTPRYQFETIVQLIQDKIFSKFS